MDADADPQSRATVSWQAAARAHLNGAGAGAISLAALRLGRRDALVFLLRTFIGRAVCRPRAPHWPRAMSCLCCGPDESTVARRGLAEVQDLESGERRAVWFRPSLAAAMARAGRSAAPSCGAIRRLRLRPFSAMARFTRHAHAYFHGEDRARRCWPRRWRAGRRSWALSVETAERARSATRWRCPGAPAAGRSARDARGSCQPARPGRYGAVSVARGASCGWRAAAYQINVPLQPQQENLRRCACA